MTCKYKHIFSLNKKIYAVFSNYNLLNQRKELTETKITNYKWAVRD